MPHVKGVVNNKPLIMKGLRKLHIMAYIIIKWKTPEVGDLPLLRRKSGWSPYSTLGQSELNAVSSPGVAP